MLCLQQKRKLKKSAWAFVATIAAMVLAIGTMVPLWPATPVHATGEKDGGANIEGVPPIEDKDVSKTLVPNLKDPNDPTSGDGTYKLTLSVKIPELETSSSSRANVVVIFDSSNSMHFPVSDDVEWVEDSEHGAFGVEDGKYLPLSKTYIPATDRTIYYLVGGQSSLAYTGKRYTPTWTRMNEAKAAAKTLGENLLNINESAGDESVQLAFVEFASDIIQYNDTPTTDIDTYNGWVDNCETYAYKESDHSHYLGGTNWEKALNYANNVDFEDDDPTYVIFITDGNPTARETERGEDNPRIGTVGLYGTSVGAPYPDGLPGVYGTGTSDEYGYDIDQAEIAAGNITGQGKTLYTVSIYGEANQEKLNRLHSDELYECADIDALNQAFSNIVSTLSSRLGYCNVSITDGITGMTSAAVGNAGDFTYSVVDKNGNDITETLKDAGKLPEAHFVPSDDTSGAAQGEVKWELGENNMVINGATYSVSFNVWPSQDAYDLVADLNNGTTAYSSLTEEQQAQITGSEGAYALKTNTGAWVDYTPAKETQDSSGSTFEKGDPGRVDMVLPDPMPLVDSTVSVQKVWEDSLEEQQLEDLIRAHPDYKARLKLCEGGEDYVTGIEIGTPSTESPIPRTWPETDASGEAVQHHIAAGLMVSEGAAAESGIDVTGCDDVIYEGTTYYILEPGHDYSFVEEGSDYHFELENKTWHPMVVDGKLKNVTFADGEVVDIDTLSTLTAKNMLKGGIRVYKKVYDKEGAEVEKDSTVFSITVVMKNPDDTPYSIGAETGGYRICYGSNRPADQKDFGTGGDAADNQARDRSVRYGISGGSFTVDLYAGDYIQVANVDTGVTYEVSEGTMPSGYEQIDIVYDPDTNVVEPNTSHQVVVKNRRLVTTCGLKIRKIDAAEYDGDDPSWTDGDSKKHKLLPGATFELFDGSSDEKIGTETTSSTAGDGYGLAAFDGLGEGTYMIRETEAPSGYQVLSGDIQVKLSYDTAQGKWVAELVGGGASGEVTLDGDSLTVTLADKKLGNLPLAGDAAGAAGTLVPGAILLGIGVALLLMHASRRRRGCI